MAQRPGKAAAAGSRTEGAPPAKAGLHPRNRHRHGYDFESLVRALPELGAFVAVNAHGNASIDFADPAAVRALNRALLLQGYGIRAWDLPEGYLCPPIPGRADYLHHLADLLAGDRGGAIPLGATVRVLDIGTGASAVYPLLGHREYGWSFLGSDIDPRALASAGRILAANPELQAAIRLRRQAKAEHAFQGLLGPGEAFEVSLCNPPFHASAAEAREGSRRKWRNLQGTESAAPRLNFGGQEGELWCAGGESGFVARLIVESAGLPDRILWYTSLVSKSASLPGLRRALRQAGAVEVRVLPMAQGQKQSRILAWTFLEPPRRSAWLAGRGT